MGKSGIDKARRARLDILREAALHRHVVARTAGRLQRPLDPSPVGPRQPVRHAGRPGGRHRPRFRRLAPCRRPRAAQARTTLALSLPPLSVRASCVARPATAGRSSTSRRGQTLGSLFEDMDVPAATMHRMLDQPGAKQALTRAEARHRTRVRPAGRRPAARLPLRPRRNPPRRIPLRWRQGRAKTSSCARPSRAPSSSAAPSASRCSIRRASSACRAARSTR